MGWNRHSWALWELPSGPAILSGRTPEEEAGEGSPKGNMHPTTAEATLGHGGRSWGQGSVLTNSEF